ncbi:hypothetical protein [Desulfoluna sp.]|uniref:hypothetical protein n=1 Tax=Desulfoluna sp. TaxID=2045199 RepID=UPI00261CA415|nr:hypothetical protein [Desulfoluna sp.]
MALDNVKPIKEALLRAFPSPKSYFEFRDTDKKISSRAIPKFIDCALTSGLIKKNTESDFINFLASSNTSVSKSVSDEFTFEEVVEEVAQGASVNSLVEWLNAVSAEFNMPKIQASMISRLKKNYNPNTASKRALLRVLGFWIGLKRPFFPWDFQRLLELPATKVAGESRAEEEGVRIDFSFQHNGENLDFQMMEWLKNELLQCIKDLKMYHLLGNKIHFYSTTTATLKIHKRRGPSMEPMLYSGAIRDSLSIAHQIIVRWTLSPLSYKQNSMVIGISAGNYSRLPRQMQALMEAKLPQNPTIRLTDFARLCVRLTNAKVIINEESQLYKMPNGDMFSIWAVKYFWFLYYDFVPVLIEKTMLPVTKTGYATLQNSIHFPCEPALEIEHRGPIRHSSVSAK